ncbi:MAG: hypothetical protein KDA65_09815 [Planctomycetaceae bacterium]|nr:hypothetical protein [Planctomycetaceae bacterium]
MTVQTRSVDSCELLAHHLHQLLKSHAAQVPIRELYVEVADQEVLLYGYTNTYYTKQRASHVVMDAIHHRTLVNKIEVI